MPKTKKVKAVYGRTADGPALMLPATAAAYDEMVEQMAMAMAQYSWDVASNQEYWRHDARRALRAIGISRPKEDKP